MEKSLDTKLEQIRRGLYKPADFIIAVTGNPGAADASGTVFKKAGENFTTVVQVVDSEGDVTPNYGNEATSV